MTSYITVMRELHRMKGTPYPHELRINKRKAKLKLRFKHRLNDEITRTLERLHLLLEIKMESEITS